MDIYPPFEETYLSLFQNCTAVENIKARNDDGDDDGDLEECELPLIDLSHDSWRFEAEAAASEWGFFQVMNHGISQNVLESTRVEQMNIFRQPFCYKSRRNFMNLSSSADCYRWGNAKATCLKQFQWSESFHISGTDLFKLEYHECSNIRSSIGLFATKAANLAKKLAENLAFNLPIKSSYMQETCPPSSSYLRMNRYPQCPSSHNVYGIIPHTDSDFLTILYQDQVGGLQLKKDGRWFSVKPNPNVLVVNIGDLFQALSNGVYKSIEHRVVSNPRVERYSVAYLYCPTYEAVIESNIDQNNHNIKSKALYRKFTFGEYRQQVQKDVRDMGDKVGLPRFLL